MNRLKFASVIATGTLCFSIAAPAFAKSSDEILAEQKSMSVTTVCEGRDRTLRAYGKCVGDALKRINILREEFKDVLEEERKEWYLNHSNLGVSTEYSKALKAYTDEVNAKRKLFNIQQREVEKIFFAAQKAVRATGLSSSSSSSRGSARTPVTSTAEQEAKKKCSYQKDTTALRICMRQQLRLLDPAAKKMGAVGGRTKSN